jgi:isopenicillin-N epimerase
MELPMNLNRRQLLGTGLGAAVTIIPSPGCAANGNTANPDLRDWNRVRAEFDLTPEYAHLAGLLLVSHPRSVREAIEEHRQGLNENPTHYLRDHNRRLTAAAREAAAQYMGVQPNEIALTDSTTQGLGLVYNGIHVREGQELLSSQFDYYSTHESLRFKAERTGASFRLIDIYGQVSRATADEIVARLMREVRPETRVVAMTWVHSATGLKIPVRRIADALAGHNRNRAPADRALLVVDGVHGFGNQDATMADLGCDVFVAGTHKWIFAPRGTGLFWAHPRVHDQISPTIPTFTRYAGWGGVMSPGGFKPFDHQWAMAPAFAFHQQIGKARVQERIHGFAQQLKDGLAAMRHVTLHTPRSPQMSAGIVCFEVAGVSPGNVVSRLRQQNIIASTTPYTPTYARLTPMVFNTSEEMERTLAAIRGMG